MPAHGEGMKGNLRYTAQSKLSRGGLRAPCASGWLLKPFHAWPVFPHISQGLAFTFGTCCPTCLCAASVFLRPSTFFPEDFGERKRGLSSRAVSGDSGTTREGPAGPGHVQLRTCLLFFLLFHVLCLGSPWDHLLCVPNPSDLIS